MDAAQRELWDRTLAEIHAEVRSHTDEYVEAGKWLDTEYSEQRCRELLAASKNEQTVQHLRHSSHDDRAPAVGEDSRYWRLSCAVVDLAADPPDLRVNAFHGEPVLWARRVLLVTALVSDPKVGEYAIALTELASLEWLSPPPFACRSNAAPTTYTNDWQGPLTQLVPKALERVREANPVEPSPEPDPRLRLHYELNGLHALFFNSWLIADLAKHRRAQIEARLNRQKIAVGAVPPGSKPLLVDVVSMMDNPAVLDQICGFISEARKRCERARKDLREGGAKPLDKLADAGTAVRPVEIGTALLKTERTLVMLTMAVEDTRVLLDQHAADIGEYQTFFGKARDDLGMAMELEKEYGAARGAPPRPTESWTKRSRSRKKAPKQRGRSLRLSAAAASGLSAPTKPPPSWVTDPEYRAVAEQVDDRCGRPVFRRLLVRRAEAVADIANAFTKKRTEHEQSAKASRTAGRATKRPPDDVVRPALPVWNKMSHDDRVVVACAHLAVIHDAILPDSAVLNARRSISSVVGRPVGVPVLRAMLKIADRAVAESLAGPNAKLSRTLENTLRAIEESPTPASLGDLSRSLGIPAPAVKTRISEIRRIRGKNAIISRGRPATYTVSGAA